MPNEAAATVDTPRPRPSASLPPHLRKSLPIALLVLVFLTAWLYGRRVERPVVHLQGEALGTTWSVKLVGDGLEAADEQRAARAAKDALARIDVLMSTWRDDSELARWNASRSTEPAALASETIAVFAIAEDVFRASRGAFDVTVGPLVRAWGFGPGEIPEPPGDEALRALRARVGGDRLRLDRAGGTLAKQVATLEADLSAVAKGYAVDEIARRLDALGHEAYLVEVGGELRARGTKREGAAWRVAIETPTGTALDSRRVHRVVELRDQSMATSGDYRNYRETPDGRRLSHTIDPRSGLPIAHRLASVTVLHPEAALADAWATALNVLGPDAGYALAEEQGLAAYLIVRSRRTKGGQEADEPFEIRVTPAFEAHLTKDGASLDVS